jgi:hypothetical protein
VLEFLDQRRDCLGFGSRPCAESETPQRRPHQHGRGSLHLQSLHDGHSKEILVVRGVIQETGAAMSVMLRRDPHSDNLAGCQLAAACAKLPDADERSRFATVRFVLKGRTGRLDDQG